MHKPLYCLAIALTLLSACDPGASPGAGQSAASQQAATLEEQYAQAGKPFAEAIMKQDYAKAYAMLSPKLSAIMPLQEFEAAHRKARLEYFAPVQMDEPYVVETEPLALAGKVDPAGDELTQAVDRMSIERYVGDVPGVIPADIRRASVTVPLYNTDPEADDVRCYFLSFLLVEEDGRYNVGHFFYRWYDMLD